MQANMIVELIRNVYVMLEEKQISTFLDAFSTNAVLHWGPFEYTGSQEIKRWVDEFFELFTSIHIVDRAINVKADVVYHDFLIEVVTLDKKRGVMPVSGIYKLEDGHFQRFDLTPRDSILYLNSRLYNGLKF